MLCANLLRCCCPRTWPAGDPGATQRQVNTFFTLHTCTSHSTLHLISSHLSSSHLFSPHLNSSHLVPISSHTSSKEVLLNCFHLIRALIILEVRLNSSQLFCTLESSYCQREDSCTKPLGAESFCTQKLEAQMHLHRKALPKYFVPQSLQKALPSTSLYYKACAKHFPVLLCTTQLAQSTPQYYSVLQSLHKVLPSTTLYYKACTKYFLVLLCTTKLAQCTLQNYFVLQSLHKARPSTTLYYKACAKHYPVYFVLQSLHKALPSTTFYYKACTKHVPVLHCTTKLAQSISQCCFVLQSLHKVLPSTTLYYKACKRDFPVYYLVLQSLHKARPSTTVHYKARKQNVPVLPCTTKLAQSTSQYYFVQPLHCVLQHHVANPHLSTRMATKRDNNHIAI